MARLIPGRVRNEGITLYEQGLVEFLTKERDLLLWQVDGMDLQLSSDDETATCDCLFFSQKGYCAHLAAVEHALKNDKSLKNLSPSQPKKLDKAEMTPSFGRVFLENLSLTLDDSQQYRLSAFGQISPYSAEIWWTLKINRLPDQRAYIIRDIKAFLTTVRKGAHYQLGKHYFEPLSLSNFDEASQKVIEFLWRVIPRAHTALIDYYLPNQGRHLSFSPGFFAEGVKLLLELEHFVFEDGKKSYAQLTFRDLEPSQGLYQFKISMQEQMIDLLIEEKEHQLFFDNDYLWYQGSFYQLNLQQIKLVTALQSLPLQAKGKRNISFFKSEQAQLASRLSDFQCLGPVSAPDGFVVKDFTVSFDLDLALDGRVVLTTCFDYGQVLISSRKEQENLPFTSDFEHERQVFTTLEALGFLGDFRAYHPSLSSHNLSSFFTQTLAVLERLGTVRLSEELARLQVVSRPEVVLHHQGGLLEISFDFEHLMEDDIRTAMRALLDNQEHFVSQSGQLMLFDQGTRRLSKALQGLNLVETGVAGQINLPTIHAPQLLQLTRKLPQLQLTESLEQLAYDLTHPEDFGLADLPIKATLRDYQLTGVKWLSMLDYYGFGGILADDMGLGKTLQTIAFLASRLDQEAKVLILAPSSLIYNWQDELEKFAPHLDVAVAYGHKTAREGIIAADHQLTITSYASFRQDIESYQAKVFDYLILDEAQMMKNTQSKLAQYLRQFEVKRCFALSGTPIENKLLEIWSIFQVVMPGLLPSKNQFNKLSPTRVARLIQPFVLRRKKEDVLPELPELTEMVHHNELADEQKTIYLAQLRQMQEQVSQTTDQDFQSRQLEILSGLMRLRQICDTPSLFMDYQGASGKLDSLVQLLQQLKESQRRVLIFSQFRGMLDLVEAQLTKLGLTSFTMTGTTASDMRQEMTRRFNQGERDAFLISLKAGGVGLNLTGADAVILIDLWWNPAVEMQAIGRAHRLGQERPVDVYRLITRGTIEEKILALQESKRHLITTVLDGQASKTSLSLAEIRDLLGLID